MKNRWKIVIQFDSEYSAKDVQTYLDTYLDFSEIVDYRILED